MENWLKMTNFNILKNKLKMIRKIFQIALFSHIEQSFRIASPFKRGGAGGIFIILCLCVLSSCMSTKSQPKSFITEKQREAWLASLETWQASGRFSVKKGNEGASGSFDWTQFSKNNYEIHFYGPFGTGNAYLTVYPGEAIWKDNEGIIKAENPDLLITQKTGYYFPAYYLDNWILGDPGSDLPITPRQYDNQGHLIHLDKAGWQVSYLAYTPVRGGELPSKIEMYYDDIKIKLIINDWKIS